MKKRVILIILLLISMPISFAYEEKIYMYGNGLIASKESNNQDLTYYHKDYLSSNRFITDNNGDIIGNNVQEPYGADIDEKGGTLVSISYVLGKPIIYLGTGQSYGDIEKFNLEKLMEKLGF